MESDGIWWNLMEYDGTWWNRCKTQGVGSFVKWRSIPGKWQTWDLVGVSWLTTAIVLRKHNFPKNSCDRSSIGYRTRSHTSQDQPSNSAARSLSELGICCALLCIVHFCAFLCAIRAALGVASFRSRRFSSNASRSSRQPLDSFAAWLRLQLWGKLCQLHQIVSLGISWFWFRMSTMKACQTSSFATVSVLATLFINISQNRQEPEMCRHLVALHLHLFVHIACLLFQPGTTALKGILKWVLAFISVEFEWNYSMRPVPLFWNKVNLPVGKTTGEKTGTPMLQATNPHNTT